MRGSRRFQLATNSRYVRVCTATGNGKSKRSVTLVFYQQGKLLSAAHTSTSLIGKFLIQLLAEPHLLLPLNPSINFCILSHEERGMQPFQSLSLLPTECVLFPRLSAHPLFLSQPSSTIQPPHDGLRKPAPKMGSGCGR